MSEPSYSDGEVVWVKWRSCWWPGEVWSDTRVPREIITSLRKPVMVFVKFFQEESFEFVRNHSNIMKYNCDKKLDFIKKGMDKFRNNKVMVNFPADVTKAEELTKGNVNILKTFESPAKPKASPVKPHTESSPAVVSKKAAGEYNTSSKVQLSVSAEPKSDKKFACSKCNFSTDRINLLMFHIKTHSSAFPSRVSDPSPTIEVKKPVTTKSPAKKAPVADDSIADDVRKIKESMKPKPVAKKVAKEQVKATATPGRPRTVKKEVVKEPVVVKVEEKPKPVNELKNELLADWMDDDDEIEKPPKIEEPPKPAPPPEKLGESSRIIRNIPKKQRVSELYIQPEPPKVEQRIEAPKPVEDVSTPDIVKKTPKAHKRKHTADAQEPEPKKLTETDDNLLTATAELLNVTEVPKVENAQVPTTFHKSNDIDKRNLPPKERNKLISRAEINSDAVKVDNNGTSKKTTTPAVKEDELITAPNELMLPHKKKQSSRLLHESRSPPSESRSRKKRKSAEPTETEPSNSHEPEIPAPALVQSPLRDASTNELTINSTFSNPRRGQKRRISKDSHDDIVTPPEPKRLHKSESESQPRSIVACASETICISSKGQLSVARRDSLVTTQANTVMVTSQVIITEATRQPIVSSASCTDSIKSPISTIKLPSQALKNAVKFPAEKLIEMKKQGLVTTGSDMKNKWTEKGKQIFKEQIKEKTAEVTEEKVALEPERIKSPELPAPAPIIAPAAQTVDEDVAVKPIEPVEDEKVLAPEEKPEPKEPEVPAATIDESTNNNEAEKEAIVVDAPPAKETQEEPEPLENGKETETEPDVPTEDPNSGGAGLIALLAESFGGPPNCFYLCRQVGEGGYEPVDNQILVLNAQNALVPYEGEIVTEDAFASNDVASENFTNYPQQSPNSNIIINTPNGQKIELNHMTILALQEQADENGNASIELSGEQLELNINWILDAINAQQEANEGDALLPGTMLIDGDGALILETPDLPVEIHHSATQVSETLTKPIMSTTVAPEISSSKVTISEVASRNLNIEDSLATIGVTNQPARANVPKSLELPITVTNPQIAETVNHRKLANAPILGDLEVAIVPESFVLQSADNGSED